LGVFITLSALLLPTAVFAQSGTWITTATGTYNGSDASNWQNGVVADGANNTASVTAAGAQQVVDLVNETAPMNKDRFVCWAIVLQITARAAGPESAPWTLQQPVERSTRP
jgi:hypothetical protein